MNLHFYCSPFSLHFEQVTSLSYFLIHLLRIMLWDLNTKKKIKNRLFRSQSHQVNVGPCSHVPSALCAMSHCEHHTAKDSPVLIGRSSFQGTSSFSQTQSSQLECYKIEKYVSQLQRPKQGSLSILEWTIDDTSTLDTLSRDSSHDNPTTRIDCGALSRTFVKEVPKAECTLGQSKFAARSQNCGSQTKSFGSCKSQSDG